MAVDERGSGSLDRGALDLGWTAERALAALVDAIDEAVLLFDAGLRCRAAGGRVAALFGVDPPELLGLPRAEVLRRLSRAADDPAAFEAAIAAAAIGPQRVEVVRPEPRVLVWTAQPLIEGGAAAGAMDLARDVTRELAAERRADEAARALSAAATLDPTTGLMNRRQFLHELDREHRRAQRAWDSYAIARVDVDRMKALNVAQGRGAGDALLRRLGEELRAARREYDVVARWESDEFVVCLPGVDAKAATVVVQRALMNMRERAREATGQSVTMSAGIAVWIPPSGDGPEDVIRRAGDALEAARIKGPSSILVDAGGGRWKDGMTEG
jgi:diguanylate cyclase (GGDEF)-like protein